MNFPQLPLPISLPNDETFSSFYAGDNSLLINILKNFLNETKFKSLYLWSKNASGRTHLLHSACNEYADRNQLVSYIPLDEHKLLSPDILVGLDNYDLVCLDNIEQIAGDMRWEESIFDLFNKLTEKQSGKLLITATLPPKQAGFQLPDLVSRLEWGQVCQLKELNDEQKIAALQLRAMLRGFDLPTDVGAFLLKRVARDMRTLCILLEQLDTATIVEQRKLTIPFIKSVLGL